MNDLLWLLYLADFLNGLTVVLILSAIAIGIAGVARFIAIYSDRNVVPSGNFKFVALVIVLALSAAMVPTRNVLYIAAGLRAGEVVAQTEQGRKALRLLDAALDKALGAVEQ